MKYSKILVFLGISCVVGLLLLIGVKLQAQNETKEKLIAVKERQMSPQAAQRAAQFRNRQQNWSAQGRQQASNWGGQQRSNSSEADNSSDFYGMIVDNNLFRPLGWRPPNKEPEYTLIGTAFDPNGGPSEAFVLEQRSNQFYVARVGDKVGDTVVKEIEQKKVTLDKNGETITLRRGNIQFLGSGGSRRSSPSRSESANRNESDNNESSSKSSDKDDDKAKAAAEKMKAQEMAKMREMQRRFQNASRGDRERMIREFRERGGTRGRRGGNR